MAKEKKANRSAYMAFLSGAATADCEADLDNLLQIFNPVESRSQMGEIFRDTLGYNPITHYDMQDIMTAIDDALQYMSESGRMKVNEGRDTIAKYAWRVYEDNRLRNINDAVVSALSSVLSSDDANSVSIGLTGAAIPILEPDEDEEEEGLRSVGSDDDDDLSIEDFENDLSVGDRDEDEDETIFDEEEDDEEDD